MLPVPHSLQIVKYPDDRGNELTDTYHDRHQGAIDQANWEFSIKPEEWESVEIEAEVRRMKEDRKDEVGRMKDEISPPTP